MFPQNKQKINPRLTYIMPPYTISSTFPAFMLIFLATSENDSQLQGNYLNLRINEAFWVKNKFFFNKKSQSQPVSG